MFWSQMQHASHRVSQRRDGEWTTAPEEHLPVTIMRAGLETAADWVQEVVLVGPKRAGKSAVVRRLAQLASIKATIPGRSIPSMALNYRPTMGSGVQTDFLLNSAKGVSVLLRVRDTAGFSGSEGCVGASLKKMQNSLYLLAFSLTSLESFHSAQQYFDCNLNLTKEQRQPVILCGLQSDQERKRKVAWSQVNKWARANKMVYTELSSYNDENMIETVLAAAFFRARSSMKAPR
eukprot:TRINITY_DN50123_c0_g1_i1.p1 TRINITY_DN50123_c0_g1~~TRINITY_DN50123_c0_g1_i1.p1  ORF type:complete len:234 (+),score=22.25 TRINITY_DN50123_c0_g1_i1:133-834(+)